MMLSELNPRTVLARVLWFDCPLHRGDPLAPCHGEVGVILTPNIDGSPGGIPNGWGWSGDWSTWRVTVRPSIQSMLCGLHISITDGRIDPA